MATKKALNFEESMERIEEIVRLLESGGENLDASLKLYEEGLTLVRACTEKLDSAEQTVKILQMKADGSATLEDFEGYSGEKV